MTAAPRILPTPSRSSGQMSLLLATSALALIAGMPAPAQAQVMTVYNGQSSTITGDATVKTLTVGGINPPNTTNLGVGSLDWVPATPGGSAVLTVTGSAAIGQNANTGSGKITLDGPTEGLKVGQALFVGSFGVGSMTIINGADVLNGQQGLIGNQGVISNQGPSSGTVLLSGTGSTWTNNSYLAVGNYGAGQLTVSDGGKVTSNTTLAPESVDNYIAWGTGSKGIALVTGRDADGNASTWQTNMHILMGRASNADGTLTIADGALVDLTGPTASSSYIGLGGRLNSYADYGGRATLNIGNGGTAGTLIAAGGVFGANNRAIVNFNFTDTADFSPDLLGLLAVNQLNTGTTTLAGNNTYAGLTTVAAGTLQAGSANAFSAKSDFTVTGGTLDANGISQTLNSLSNSGVVATNAAGTTTGTLLTVNGNYAGTNGVVMLNTQVGDNSSPTDMLVVNGNVTGTTSIVVRNVGGLGAQTTGNGIQLVQVNGTSDAAAFDLVSPVSAGAFDYDLFQGSVDGSDANAANEYLRSVGYTASTQTVLPYAQVLGNYAVATLGTLQQRTGNRIWPNGAPTDGSVLEGQGAWARTGGQFASFGPGAGNGSAYDQNLGFLQGGYEGAVYEGDAGVATLGVYATLGSSEATIDLTRDPVTEKSRQGTISTAAYGVGANATWLGNDGLYVDGIGQFTWYDSSLSNKPDGNNQGYSTALSLEIGKRFDLGSGWAVVPQAQLEYANVDFDDFTDVNGASVSLGDGDSLRGRAGVRIENLNNWQNADGTTERLQLYGTASVSYEFLDGTSVDVAGTSVKQQDRKLRGELGLGASYDIGNDWSLNGEASYGTALAADSGDNGSLKGTLGLRFKW